MRWLWLLVVSSVCVASDEPRAPFAFQAALPARCQGALRSDEAIQRCLTTLNDERPLPFNCSQLSRLRYTGAEPFATGTHKEAFRGVFDKRVDVVIKRPRRSALHGVAPPSAALDFVEEAMLMVLLRAPMHVELLGHCYRDMDTLNVVRYATPWREIVPDRSLLSYEARVDVATQLVDMLQWWLDSPFGSLVHCDIYDFQFALLPPPAGGHGARRFGVQLVDLDGLRPEPVTPAHACGGGHVGEPAVCGRHCFKGEHYRAKVYGAFAQPLEAVCVEGACRGFDASFNVWTVCRVLFFDLFLLNERPGVVPESRVDYVRSLLDECAAPDPRERPSLRRLRAKLDKLAVTAA
jgi:hypothetical protein